MNKASEIWNMTLITKQWGQKSPKRRREGVRGAPKPMGSGDRAQGKDLPQKNQESFHINKTLGRERARKFKKKKKKSTLQNEYYISKLDARKYKAK